MGRGKRKTRKLPCTDLPDRHAPPAVDVEKLDVSVNSQGLSALHLSSLYGQLDALQRLAVSSLQGQINGSDPQGRRPIHMVMSWRSAPNTSACLRCLLEHGADVNIATDCGQTPLHVAASEGLLDCTQTLVQAGADVTSQDSMGHTPLDLARIWCHREVARYLKTCMWEVEKRKEMKERKLAHALYRELIATAKVNDGNKGTLIDEKMAEWAKKKGFPHLKDYSPKVSVSQYHMQCLSSNQDGSDRKATKGLRKNQRKVQQEITFSKSPAAAEPEIVDRQRRTAFSELDLRGSVTVWRDSSSSLPHYTTKWDTVPHTAPDLPLDVLKKVLFPRAFPSRIFSPQHFQPQNIEEVQHKGSPKGRSSSPWTEVAMHMAEVLEPGHY
ncbi:ankyrin repeat domain-containing protein 53 [Solea solea]|uniref:ankyrin repeat domain-containing protein 53 n=1 Tax=Solea solea TaxID=90069 RepID=UPI00272BCED6|nr:ankyrin repeat domain-containing protein 53 [Solea solea]